MKLGVFAMISQLNTKVLNGSHQHHQKSKVKKMLVCFYDSKGIIHHEFVPEGQTVTGSFYLSVLEHQWKRIRRVRPEYSAPRRWFLLRDNAPVHRAVVQEFLARKQVYVLHHPPYSPDLSPCYYFLFPTWSYHWKDACLKMFKTSKQLWLRVFPGHTTGRRAEVLPVFARSCHSLCRCRRDVLWIKYR